MILGSARASRAGDRALAIATFSESTALHVLYANLLRGGRRNEHARRVRSPEL
jgi:hypothetical protein